MEGDGVITGARAVRTFPRVRNNLREEKVTANLEWYEIEEGQSQVGRIGRGMKRNMEVDRKQRLDEKGIRT